MRDQRVVRCTYYLESEIEPARGAAILCPTITVLWARRVLKQPAGGSREAEAALATDLHVHLDHVPADTGEAALEAAHLTILDTAADQSRDSDRSTTADRGSGEGGGSGSSGRESTSDPTSRRPDPNGRGDLSNGEADA